MNLHPSVVNCVQRVHDYWQITTDKYSLSIYNPVVLKNYNNEQVHLDLYSLINKPIVDCVLNEGEYIVLFLNEGYKLFISLRGEDYLGPEAIQIKMHSGKVIIF